MRMQGGANRSTPLGQIAPPPWGKSLHPPPEDVSGPGGQKAFLVDVKRVGKEGGF